MVGQAKPERVLGISLALSAALALFACSSGEADLIPVPREPPATTRYVDIRSSFELLQVDALEEPLAEKGPQLYLAASAWFPLSADPDTARPGDGQPFDNAQVAVVSTEPLVESLYLHLRYDPALMHPVHQEVGTPLADSGLHLFDLGTPGLVRFAVAPIGEGGRMLDPAGGQLFVVYFASGPAVNARSLSAAPSSPVEDLAFDAGSAGRLEWTCYNNGDCDQNGSVTIGDVTPIGQHFGKSSGSGDWSSARVADSDMNGLVGIADLTPIGQNFGSRVTSFVLRESAQPEGPFAFVEGSITAFDSATIPGGGGPRPFACQLAAPAAGSFYIVAARDGQSESAAQSNAVQYVPGNAPPEVSLDSSSLTPQPGLKELFTATASDSDGSIAALDWDSDGDGSFETPGDPLDPQIFMTFTELGPAVFGVRVTDDQGAQSSASVELDVSFGQRVERSLDSDDSFERLSMAETTSGRPVLAYLAADARHIRYLRPTSDSALTWFTPQQIDNNLDTVGGLELSIIDDRPAIAYGDADDTYYIRAADAEGSSWGAVHILPDVANGERAGRGVSLLEVQSKPAVVFAGNDDIVTGVIWYRLAEDAAGMSWEFEDPLSTLEQGSEPSLRMAGTRPAVCYMRGGDPELASLAFRRASDASGSIWTSEITVPTGGEVHTCTSSLIRHSGDAAGIVYWSGVDDSLYFSAATDETGIEWGEPQLIGSAAGTQSRFAAFCLNGLPMVLWSSTNPAGVYLACASRTSGSEWGSALEIDGTAPLSHVALGEFNSRPVAAWQDATGSLRVALFTEP